MKTFPTTVVLGACLLVVLAGVAEACPTCKEGLAAADSQGANIARGYFYSILLMLAMPFTLAGSFGLYVWREFRRQQQAGPTALPSPGFGGGLGGGLAGEDDVARAGGVSHGLRQSSL